MVGSKVDQRKIHLIQKEKLYKINFNGGLRFESLKVFNEAMLAKQEWIMYTNHDTIIETCYKAYLETCILNGQVGTRHRYVWRNIDQVNWILKRG
jgi:hypothetical protein